MQARSLDESQIQAALRYIAGTRYPERDRVILLLSERAGLRPREIAGLTWPMVTGRDGRIGDRIMLDDPVNPVRRLPEDLRAALEALRLSTPRKPGDFVVTTERAPQMTPASVSMWFQRLWKDALGVKAANPGAGEEAGEAGEAIPLRTEPASARRQARPVASRELIWDCVSAAVAAAGQSDQNVAVVVIDLDGFSRVNTVFGDEFGDSILAIAAEWLGREFGGAERVLRRHADKFVALLPGLKSRQDAAVVVRQAWQAFHHPILCEGRNICLTASIGACVFPDDGRDAETLLRHADAALHTAKSDGGDRYSFFSGTLSTSYREELDLESRMRTAFDRNEFLLHYQPTVDVFTRQVIGAEALARWEISGGGVIPPGKFIPLAERTGFILPLGSWILKTACRQIRTWQAAGHACVPISVNVSGEQVKDPNFAALVQWTLRETDLDPRLLNIELTESIFMEDSETAVEGMNKLARLGVRFSVDDFGTGYSSLKYLRRFPVHHLKIDQFFVKDIDEDRNAAAMARTIVGMAHSLGMKAIAEGVEKEEQCTILRAYQCDQAQGYLFYRPMRAESFRELLVRQPERILHSDVA